MTSYVFHAIHFIPTIPVLHPLDAQAPNASRASFFCRTAFNRNGAIVVLTACGVILETLQSSILIFPLQLKAEGPQVGDVAKGQQLGETKKKNYPNKEHTKNKGNTSL